MVIFEQFAEVLMGAVLAAGGVAIGKIWGSHGTQTLVGCSVTQAACKNLILEKLLSLDKRLERIEHKLNEV
jgi:hypothetical protein